MKLKFLDILVFFKRVIKSKFLGDRFFLNFELV